METKINNDNIIIEDKSEIIIIDTLDEVKTDENIIPYSFFLEEKEIHSFIDKELNSMPEHYWNN